MDGSWDYIVVGAGSAGCVVARRLSDRRDLRILVLEAGDRDWSPYLQVPAGRIRMNVKYDWNYPAEPDRTRGGKVENWESGRVLGGTSSINGMNWSRGDPSDYDEWVALGAEGWDFQSVRPTSSDRRPLRAAPASTGAAPVRCECPISAATTRWSTRSCRPPRTRASPSTPTTTPRV